MVSVDCQIANCGRSELQMAQQESAHFLWFKLTIKCIYIYNTYTYIHTGWIVVSGLDQFTT